MSSSGGRFTTPANHGPLVAMAVGIGLVWSLLVFSIRMFIRVRIVPPFGVDDTFATIALVLVLAQAAATSVSIHFGIGHTQASLNKIQYNGILGASEAAAVLYILSIAASKCSTTLLIARLTRFGKHLIACYTAIGLTAAWAFASVFLISFPRWTAFDSTYIIRYVRWIVIESLSMAIEVIIFLLSIYLVWSLYMPLKTKAIVVAAFFCRILIIIPTVFRLLSIRDLSNSKDPSRAAVGTVIITQVVLHYSFIASTLPCMKQFLRAWNTDLGYTVDINVHAKSLNSIDALGSGSSSTAIGSQRGTIRAKDRSFPGNSYVLEHLKQERGLRQRTPESQRQANDADLQLRSDKVLSVSKVEAGALDAEIVDGKSVAESERSDKAIIRMTKDWNVSYQGTE